MTDVHMYENGAIHSSNYGKPLKNLLGRNKKFHH